MSNSLIDLSARLKQESVAQGWGAIVVMSRARLNQLLEQDFIASFGRQQYLPLINGEAVLDPAGTQVARLSDLQLGPPLLSFITASLTNSRVSVRMPIISGRYSTVHRTHTAPQALTSSFALSQAQDYWLEMEVNLNLVIGEVSRKGEITVSLPQAVNFRCNLAGDAPLASERLGEIFRRSFQALSVGKGVFRLGVIDLKHYGQLSPKGFRILTQAAPGARIAGALNWGDGAVVLLIRLEANPGEGTMPPTPRFPYLIPDDKSPNGSDLYTATLLLAEEVRQGSDMPPVLQGLRFPGGNQFRSLYQEREKDVVWFGSIGQVQGNMRLEPVYSVLQAGRSLELRLLDYQGQPVGGATWTAVSLGTHDPAGHGTIANGRYTAPTQALIGDDCQNVVITARLGSGRDAQEVSALVLVVFDSMQVMPRMSVHGYEAEQAPIRLSASTLYQPVAWELQGTTYGELSARGEHDAFFEPAPGLRRKSLVAQRIEARGDQAQPASVLLSNGQQLLGVEPFAVNQVRRSANVQLHDDPTLLPGLSRRWSVIGGEGQVDASGTFRAPGSGISADSVVLCEIVHNDVVFSSGYSVLEMSELEDGPTWSNIDQFSVRAVSFPNPAEGRLYSNGFQQLQVEVTVKTVPAGNKPARLNAYEINSIRLRELQSNQDVLWSEAEGMDEDSRVLWRTNHEANRYDRATSGQLAASQAVGPDTPVPETAPLDDNTVSVTFYLQSRAPGNTAVKFLAVLQQDRTNRWWQSPDRGEAEGIVNILASSPPGFNETNYTLEGTRVDGGGQPGSDPVEDGFDYFLRTIDYWKVRCKDEFGRANLRFLELEFVPVPHSHAPDKVRLSSIRWESELLWETMFSWTGYAYHDADEGPGTLPQNLTFDEDLPRILPQVSDPLDERKLPRAINQTYFASGELMISLLRSDRVDYVPPQSSSHAIDASFQRDRLDDDMRVMMRDQHGNLHKLNIAFASRGSEVGHRNRLVLNTF